MTGLGFYIEFKYTWFYHQIDMPIWLILEKGLLNLFL